MHPYQLDRVPATNRAVGVSESSRCTISLLDTAFTAVSISAVKQFSDASVARWIEYSRLRTERCRRFESSRMHHIPSYFRDEDTDKIAVITAGTVKITLSATPEGRAVRRVILPDAIHPLLGYGFPAVSKSAVKCFRCIRSTSWDRVLRLRTERFEVRILPTHHILHTLFSILSAMKMQIR